MIHSGESPLADSTQERRIITQCDSSGLCPHLALLHSCISYIKFTVQLKPPPWNNGRGLEAERNRCGLAGSQDSHASWTHGGRSPRGDVCKQLW